MGTRIGKRLRQTFVFLHVAASVGWMGAGAANVVLALTAVDAPVAVQRSCYLMIDQIDAYLVIPLAFAALASGVLVSVLTPWGLARYWWVLVKLVLTVAVILYSTFGVGVWVLESIDATGLGRMSHVQPQLAYGAMANLVAFLFMTWASIAKPWGTTPWAAARRRRGKVLT